MAMHIVHKGTTSAIYGLNIGGSKVSLAPNARTASQTNDKRPDLEAAIAQYAANGDLEIQYDGIFFIDATVPAGSATPSATATGLAATDIILAATQKTKGANSLPLLGFGAPGSGSITLTYSADPGASGVVRLLVQRP